VYQLAIPTQEQMFIEFGVEDYREANTRFLSINNNWRGLVMDSDSSNVLRSSVRRDLLAARTNRRYRVRDCRECRCVFQRHGVVGDIGLLHIDIDGNDYWIWRAIQSVRPVIVIVEYNAVLGSKHAVTVPYDPALFVPAHTTRTCSTVHHLLRWRDLGAEKGYAFLGCNRAGNNAYFVRRDRLGPLVELPDGEGFVPSRFRESRDYNGAPTFLSGDARLREIASCTLYDTRTRELVQIASLLDRED
jgi:hypothetical protein